MLERIDLGVSCFVVCFCLCCVEVVVLASVDANLFC